MWIDKAEMHCSVGTTGRSSCAAIRAGISGHLQLPYYAEDGAPVIGSPAPGLSSDYEDAGRLLELLVHCITNCLVDQQDMSGLPLIACLPERGRPGALLLGTEDEVIREIERCLGQQLDRRSHCIEGGHTSCFQALRIAERFLERKDVKFCLVCAADSYLNSGSLRWLETAGRLKSETNSDGLIPGEAAAAVLLRRETAWKDRARARVLGVGFAEERAHVLSDTPIMGLALTEALRSALAHAGLQAHDISFRVSDVTGERYGFKEMSLALSRTLRERLDELPIWCLADSIGDVGAAAGACQLVMVHEAVLRGYAPGDRAACSTAAVLGRRAVAIVGC